MRVRVRLARVRSVEGEVSWMTLLGTLRGTEELVVSVLDSEESAPAILRVFRLGRVASSGSLISVGWEGRSKSGAEKGM